MGLTGGDKKHLAALLGAQDDECRFYVYVLCDGFEPFYVGKGSGDRVEEHAKEADCAFASIDADKELCLTEKKKQTAALKDRIRAIHKAGGDLKEVIVKWGLTEDEAFMCESSLINLLKFYNGYGGKKDGKGGLLTNIKNGHASMKEKSSRAVEKTKARALADLLKECAPQKRDVATLRGRKVLMIKIDRLYRKYRDCDASVSQDDWVSDVVRGFWTYHTVAKDKREQVEFVMALVNGVVEGVYHVKEVDGYHLVGEDASKDYPIYPSRIRTFDRLSCECDSLAEVKRRLGASGEGSIKEFRNYLHVKSNVAIKGSLRRFKQRCYYSLDKERLDGLQEFLHCIPIRNGRTDFLEKRRQIGWVNF